MRDGARRGKREVSGFDGTLLIFDKGLYYTAVFLSKLVKWYIQDVHFAVM